MVAEAIAAAAGRLCFTVAEAIAAAAAAGRFTMTAPPPLGGPDVRTSLASLTSLSQRLRIHFPDVNSESYSRSSTPPRATPGLQHRRELLPVFSTAESYSLSCTPKATPGLQHRRELLPVFSTAESYSFESYARSSTPPRATPGGLCLIFLVLSSGHDSLHHHSLRPRATRELLPDVHSESYSRTCTPRATTGHDAAHPAESCQAAHRSME